MLTLTFARNGDLGFVSESSSLGDPGMAEWVLPIVLANDFRRDLTWLEARDPPLTWLYRRGPRSMAVSWDSTSIPNPVVIDSARKSRLSNSLGSMSVSSESSSMIVSSSDICP